MLSVLKSFSIKLSQLTAIKRIARPHSLCKVPSAGSRVQEASALNSICRVPGAGSLDTEQSLQGASALNSLCTVPAAGCLGTKQSLHGASLGASALSTPSVSAHCPLLLLSASAQCPHSSA